MNTNKKMLSAISAAALCILAAVPAVSFAADAENSYKSEWVKDEQGRFFYYDADGNIAVGEQTIEDADYLFSKNGVLKTGWRTVKGRRCYFDPETGKHVYGKIDLGGSVFFLAPSGEKLTNAVFSDENNDLFITDEKGAVITEEGLIENNGATYYVTQDSSLARGDVRINNIVYVFDENGVQETGWVEADGKTYYFSPESGNAVIGKVVTDEGIFYVDAENGRCGGIFDIDGIEYKFSDETGKLVTGWVEVAAGKRYYYDDGTFPTSPAEIDGVRYLFNEDGVLSGGLFNYEGNIYFANEEGILQQGYQPVDSTAYFFGEDYTAQKGFIDIDGKRYLFGDDYKMKRGMREYENDKYLMDSNTGVMRYGLIVYKGETYYFDTVTGKMQYGWFTDGSKKYYMGPEGCAVKGIYEVDGKKYYFHVDTGVMTTGRLIIDGSKYYFADNGVMKTGWATFDEGKYYFDKSTGKMVTGWKTIDGSKYYFDKSTGKMVTNTIVGDYNLREDGTAVEFSAVQKRAKTILDSIGRTPGGIYTYVCGHNRYSYIENTRSLSQIESKGWSYFANYALDNRFVVCYYFAAVTDLLFQQAGLKSRIVYGTGRGTGDHYWNQVYDSENKVWLNYDTCNGYRAVSFAYLQTQNYTFKQYVYPKFY